MTAKFVHGEKLLDAVSSDNDHVFTGLVKDEKHASIAVVSASSKTLSARISISPRVLKKAKWVAVNIVNQKPVKLSKKEVMTITLRPYEVVIIRLY